MVASRIVITEMDFDRLTSLLQQHRSLVTARPYLAALEHELDRCKVVPPAKVAKGVVTMNSQVKIEDSITGEEDIYTLVYPEDADLDQLKISVLAPLGTAMLGVRAGDTIRWQAPGGEQKARVTEILYQPEASGDYHL